MDNSEIKKILIVDDDEEIILFFKALLDKEYDIIGTDDGRKAIEHIKKDDFFAVFIDVVMDKLDGVETLYEIKKIKSGVPAVMMTGYSVEEDIRKCIDIGALDFLYKPFTKSEIYAVLRKIARKDKPGKFTQADITSILIKGARKEKIEGFIKEDIHAVVKNIEKKEGLKAPPAGYAEKRRKRFLPLVPEQGKFQLKYVKIIISAILLPMLFVGAGFYAIFHLVLNTAQLGRYAEGRLGDVFMWLNLMLGFVMVISCVVGGLLGVHLSHRIAGPLYRIEKSLRKIIAGEVFEMRIRRNDELQGLVKLLNELIKKRIK
ncbi:MAG: response regulator [Elusimicrobiota bacterium]